MCNALLEWMFMSASILLHVPTYLPYIAVSRTRCSRGIGPLSGLDHQSCLLPGAAAVSYYPFLPCFFHSTRLSLKLLYIFSSSYVQIIVIQLKDDNQDVGASTDSKHAARNIKKDYHSKVEGEAYRTAEFDYGKFTTFFIGDGNSYSRFTAGNTTRPGMANRTFGNRTQSNSIRGLSSIEFGNRTKSNGQICVSSISEPIELNRTNRTQSNSIR